VVIDNPTIRDVFYKGACLVKEGKMNRWTKKTEKGQSLVLVALLLFGFMAILALVLDGGMTYFHRRNAQNAADAGALAGARVYCETEDAAAGRAAAINYVETNGAELFDENGNGTIDPAEEPQISGGAVTVKTEVAFGTFFGRVLGRDEITATAYAKAGCYSPTLGRGVIPTVWACRPPVNGWPQDSTSCQQQRITWELLQDYLDTSDNPDTEHGCFSYGNGQVCPELYIVMDSLSYDGDFNCIEDDPINGYLTCDLDGDGESDWVAEGGRSWVDLDGGPSSPENCTPTSSEGGSELTYWIENGYGCDLNIHTWVPEQGGVANSIFQTVEDRRQTNPLVVLPVFDDFCDDYPSTGCPTKYHPGTDIIHTMQPMYFHIKGFSAFYITCVREHPSDNCPGITRAMDLNTQLTKGQKQSTVSIEGYFLTGYVPGLEGRDDFEFDTGVFTVYLDQ
jgi:hypothetical protein